MENNTKAIITRFKKRKLAYFSLIALTLLYLASLIITRPFGHGPNDIVKEEELTPYARKFITITPETRIARIDLLPDGTIQNETGLQTLLPNLSTGDSILPHLPPSFQQDLQKRAQNENAPEATYTIANSITLTLPAYEKRTRPPRTIRARLKDNQTTQKIQTLTLSSTDPRLNNYVDNTDTPQGHITITTEKITWPFRPTKSHIMGIDEAGRDVLSRIFAGTRIALTFGIILVITSTLLGIIIGAIQGYFGGITDLIGQRLIEIWNALPFLYVMILVGAVIGRSFTLLLICYGLFNWIGISAYVRAEFLRLRKSAFVDAAKCQGLSHFHIILKEILPNALTPVITLIPFSLVGAIASISALDFLGFGLPPLTPSWGELLSQAQNNTSAWWLILYPSLFLFLTMLFTVFIGEGLRNALDPKPNSSYQ